MVNINLAIECKVLSVWIMLHRINQYSLW